MNKRFANPMVGVLCHLLSEFLYRAVKMLSKIQNVLKVIGLGMPAEAMIFVQSKFFLNS